MVWDRGVKYGLFCQSKIHFKVGDKLYQRDRKKKKKKKKDLWTWAQIDTWPVHLQMRVRLLSSERGTLLRITATWREMENKEREELWVQSHTLSKKAPGHPDPGVMVPEPSVTPAPLHPSICVCLAARWMRSSARPIIRAAQTLTHSTPLGPVCIADCIPPCWSPAGRCSCSVSFSLNCCVLSWSPCLKCHLHCWLQDMGGNRSDNVSNLQMWWQNVTKCVVNLSCCECKVQCALCPRTARAFPTLSPSAVVLSLSPFACSSLSRMIIGVRLYEGNWQVPPDGQLSVWV